MNELLEVGAIVRHPDREDWGLGQVQSIIGARATVNFENVGKIVVNLDEISLLLEAPDWL